MNYDVDRLNAKEREATARSISDNVSDSDSVYGVILEALNNAYLSGYYQAQVDTTEWS